MTDLVEDQRTQRNKRQRKREKKSHVRAESLCRVDATYIHSLALVVNILCEWIHIRSTE